MVFAADWHGAVLDGLRDEEQDAVKGQAQVEVNYAERVEDRVEKAHGDLTMMAEKEVAEMKGGEVGRIWT